ncbi:MAG: DUF1385 domain-containing protein [Lachnospiraceae bacterium]|nr:DUF1385 domain-containing protein [Lachnospiraceae bacterium]
MAKKKTCYSGIGGQAVLEGIMMKNKKEYAVAVRKPDGEIAVSRSEYEGILKGNIIMKIPFLRGFFVFLDSMILGIRSLNFSASFYDEEVAESNGEEKQKDTDNLLMGLTTIIAILFAIAVFMVLPYFASGFLATWIRNDSLLALIEGVIRVVIFIAYVALISLMPDIRRTYQYHGAEHKCINCIETGHELTVKNVMRSSRFHKRCGTSFLMYVMLISILLFLFIRVDTVWLKVLLRVLLIPVIAGISYELISFAGKHDNWLTNGFSQVGLWVQGLTTKEPTEDMVEVAIRAVEEVYDWKAYLQEHFAMPAEQKEA